MRKTVSAVLAFPVDGLFMIDAHIPDGAIVLANTGRTEPISGKNFVLWIEGELHVKELSLKDGLWYACSRNSGLANELPDIQIDIDDRLVEQAFWCGFEL